MDKRFIDQCELEQLHLSGAIQPHGTLLMVDNALQITHVAANLEQFVPAETGVALGRPLPAPLTQWVAELGSAVGSRLLLEAALLGRSGPLDASLTRNAQECVGIELTPNDSGDVAYQPSYPGIAPPADFRELQERRQALVQRVFELSGYQRVLYYSFREDGDGEVLAEARQAEIYGSYLGLRFPASDIPQIARILYLMNPWRQIPDAAGTPVPVLSNGAETADLSYTDLRSVSPIHALYLANMGVRASLSFPIVVGGELWGLIACHQSSPCLLGTSQLNTISHEVRSHVMAMSAFFAQRRIQMLDSLVYRFREARDILHAEGDIVTAWPKMAAWLTEEFGADGATLCMGDEYASWGVSFEENALRVFDSWFVEQQGESVWLGDRLGRQVSGFGLSRIAGVLAVKAKLSGNEFLRVYLTRQEYIHEVAWGGNPDKPVEYHDGAVGIAPRRSFEKWVEKRMGRSRPWDNEARLLGLKLRELLVEIARDV